MQEERPARPSREDWEGRVNAFGIESSSGDTWSVALILVAAADIGQNIDRLARRTGAGRPLVSKVARRLVENGVWADGVTVALWTTNADARAAFLNDVGVGEGRLLRRVPDSGAMEWAQAGRWHKNFERETDDRGTSAVYVDAAERPAGVKALPEDFEDPASRARTGSLTDEEPVGPVAPARTQPTRNGETATHGSSPAPERQAPTAPGSTPPAAPGPNGVDIHVVDGVAEDTVAPADRADADGSAESEETPSLDEVFSDAVWLS